MTADFKNLLSGEKAVENVLVHDIVLTESKDGAKSWEVYAATGQYDIQKVIAELNDIVGNYYENGEVVMSFTAPNGSYNSETKELKLFNGVKIVGKDNAKITTNSISWVTTEEKIKAEGNIVINRANEIIALANKGSVSTDFKNFELYDNAEIRVYKDKR
jgi:LPS export ABC transporter protein LptC